MAPKTRKTRYTCTRCNTTGIGHTAWYNIHRKQLCLAASGVGAAQAGPAEEARRDVDAGASEDLQNNTGDGAGDSGASGSLDLGGAEVGSQRTASQAQLTSRSASDTAGRRTRLRADEISNSEVAGGSQGSAAGHSTASSGPQAQEIAALASQPTAQDSGLADQANSGMQQSASAGHAQEGEMGHLDSEEEEDADAISVQEDDQPEELFYAYSDCEGGVDGSPEGAEDEAAAETQGAAQPETAAGVPAAKPGTAAWYRERLHDPVYAGAKLTLIQCCYLWLSMKLEGNVRDGQFDREARVMHDVMLPQPNIFPPSFYLFRQIIGCEGVQDFECHSCPKDCHSWGPLPQNQWAAHEHDVCPKCSSERFKRVGMGNSSKLTPQKVFYYLGLERTIRLMFSDPEWCELRGSGRDFSAAGFYGSAAAARMNEECGGQLFQPGNSVYELGFDFAQVFNFANHSTGALFVRCADLPESHKGRRKWTLPLVIIPGKKEPKSMAPYLRFVLDAFERLGPDGDGLRVTNYARVAGELRQVEQQHKLFLSGVAADSPARQKLASWPGVAAYVPCGWCLFQGEKLPGSKATRLRGYSQPVQHTLALGGSAYHVRNPAIQVSDQLQHGRAAAVECGDISARIGGCKGYSEIPRRLRYVSYNDLWRLPIAHAGLYGLVKGFLDVALAKYARESDRPWYVLPNAKRRIMVARGQAIVLTADFNRPYRCVVRQRGYWQLDDFMYFLESFSLQVFQDDVLEPRCQRMWELLRSSLIHYFRLSVVDGNPVGPGSSFSEACRSRARDELWEYANLLESEEMPAQLLTYNLHILVCRLHKQEEACGAVAKDLEYWVERSIQDLKSSVKYRTTEWPEKIAVQRILVGQRLHLLCTEHPEVRGFDELCPAYRAAAVKGNVDSGASVHGSQLLGVGKPVSNPEREATFRTGLRRLLRSGRPAGWSHQRDTDSAALHLHTYANKQGDEIITSTAHFRSRSRVSYFVKVTYLRTGGADVYIGRVSEFLRVEQAQSPNVPEPRVLRVACCDLFKAQRRKGMLVVDEGRPKETGYLVEVDSIDTKVLIAREGSLLHCIEYAKVSGMS